jgi:hypothetical protein
MVLTPPALAHSALVGIASTLALVAFCGGSWLLLQAAKISTTLASPPFAMVMVFPSESVTTGLCIDDLNDCCK